MMQITFIEESLTKYKNKFIRDLLDIFIKSDNRDFNSLNEDSKRIVNNGNFNEISQEDSRFSIEILNIISRISDISTEQVRISVKEENEIEIFDLVSRELGVYDKSETEIVEQVILVYQSRLIMKLLTIMRRYFSLEKYNIFLSHSSIDSREVLGIKLLLLYEYKLTAYVDWLDDFQMNYLRSSQKIINLIASLLFEKDDKTIMLVLEERYRKEIFKSSFSDIEITNKILMALDLSDNFFYIETKNARFSKWMLFELGYAEGKLNKPIYRIIIQYKRNRKGFIKHSSFLTKYKVIDDLKKIYK